MVIALIRGGGALNLDVRINHTPKFKASRTRWRITVNTDASRVMILGLAEVEETLMQIKFVDEDL
jgi:hypothetical protein